MPFVGLLFNWICIVSSWVCDVLGDLPDTNLSLQHQQSGSNLPGYSQRQLVSCADHCEGSAINLFAVDRLQPARSTRRWYSSAVSVEPRRTRQNSATVDEALCDVGCRLRRFIDSVDCFKCCRKRISSCHSWTVDGLSWCCLNFVAARFRYIKMKLVGFWFPDNFKNSIWTI